MEWVAGVLSVLQPAQDSKTAYPSATSGPEHQEVAVPQNAGVTGSVWLNLQVATGMAVTRL